LSDSKVWCPWCHRRILFEWMPRVVNGRLGLLRVKCKDCRRLATFLLTMDGALSADEHVGSPDVVGADPIDEQRVDEEPVDGEKVPR